MHAQHQHACVKDAGTEGIGDRIAAPVPDSARKAGASKRADKAGVKVLHLKG